MSTHDFKSLFDSLESLLQRMTQCTDALDDIVSREREAVKSFDGEALTVLMDLRQRCHVELSDLEAQCKLLLLQGGAPKDMRLETFIDLHAQEVSPRFQSLRRKLYQRVTRLAKDNADNHVRMRAAYDVTSGLLQHIGIIETKQTYEPREAR